MSGNNNDIPTRHPIEEKDSWFGHLERRYGSSRRLEVGGVRYEEANDNAEEASNLRANSRYLKHHHHHHDDKTKKERMKEIEEELQKKYEHEQKEEEEKDAVARAKAEKKRLKKQAKLLSDSGILDSTVHGMMIDAGSTGSRLHVYEFNPRVLNTEHEVQDAVAGLKLSFPGTESRWTERLRPGLATFASLPDDQLLEGVAEYLSPLIEFAKTVLHSKSKNFDRFPIFLKATAGMRMLNPTDRARVIDAVRTLFANKTYCPFWFEEERVRTISGEEEAIYGWAGVNFVVGTLLENSQGAGTVINPRLTYGALDMGGGSTQISFYEPNEDIMSNLFKLQIGQGKHWNVYAHSFLEFGINEAMSRMGAHLVAGKGKTEMLVDGIHNPCMPGGSKKEFRSDIIIGKDGMETRLLPSPEDEDQSGFYTAILKNDNERGDYEKCAELANTVLNKKSNAWCNFAHRGDCSFSGVYQPALPTQSEHFGEFLAFSNFYHVWDFLGLPARASIAELQNMTKHVCSMSHDELVKFNTNDDYEDEINDYCFHAAFVFEVLHNGYGFQMDDYVTATNVVNGQKVGWALGSMLYEINTLPWDYIGGHHHHITDYMPDTSSTGTRAGYIGLFFAVIVAGMAALLFRMFRMHSRRRRSQYEPIKSIEMET